MKEKLSKGSVTTCKGNISEILQDMEELCNVMLAEGENHQDFSIDLLSTLATAQDKSFLRTLEYMQDSHDS